MKIFSKANFRITKLVNRYTKITDLSEGRFNLAFEATASVKYVFAFTVTYFLSRDHILQLKNSPPGETSHEIPQSKTYAFQFHYIIAILFPKLVTFPE